MVDRQEVGVLAFEFSSADKAAVYLGLTPSTHQSAVKCYHGPITKQGAARARWLLIQAPQRMMRSAGPHGCIG